MTVDEQVRVLARAFEGGAFDELGARWNATPGGEHRDGRVAVDREIWLAAKRVLGENPKTGVGAALYSKFEFDNDRFRGGSPPWAAVVGLYYHMARRVDAARAARTRTARRSRA